MKKIKRKCRHITITRLSGDVCPVCPEPIKLTAGDMVLLKKRVIAEQCKRSFARFVQEAWHVNEPGNELQWSWHLQVICDHAQAIIEDVARAKAKPNFRARCENLMINAPPRCGKSQLVMVFLVAWAWLRWPWRTFRCLSVNPAVAQRDSRACNELVKSQWYRETFELRWKIKRDPDGVQLFENTERGFRAAAGLGAKIVGTGSDVILTDDPHDPDDVLSEAKREQVVERYDSSIHNRVNDVRACARICVMQRLHESDLAGHLLREGTYVPLLIRQVSEGPTAPTFLGWVDDREVGALMHPERFPEHFVDAERLRLGSFRFAGQHQQNPAPTEGNMFKPSWWVSFDTPPAKFDLVIMSIDLNAKKTKKGSRAACIVIGTKGPKRYILDAWAHRYGFTEAVEQIKKTRAEYPDVTKVLIEDKANGPAVIETLKLDMSGVVEINPGSDSKEARALACQPIVEAGDVALPRVAAWRDEYEHELAVFPAGVADDYVDVTSQALLHLRGTNAAARFTALCVM